MKHEMVMTEHEGIYELVCPVCGKVILIHTDPPSVEIIVKGDFFASHNASMGGLDIGGISVDRNKSPSDNR